MGHDRCDDSSVRDGVSNKPWIVDDEPWARVEPLLPAWPERSPGPRPVGDRRCLQGTLFVFCTGSPRRARRASPTGPQRSGRLSMVKAGLVSGSP
ncbi:transposase [Streptomyces sp. NPDC006662]|uniref:transposase n=1 Tax=Streptomyces sp. NPDC006662 TaxID=3156902 RepID=UPI003405305E